MQIGDSLRKKLLCFHALDMDMRKINIDKNIDCVMCGEQQKIDINSYAYHTQDIIEDHILQRKISCAELREFTQEFTIVDVRESYEFQAGHIANSILAPLGELDTFLAQWSKEQHIVVYCRSGLRSQKAVAMLLENKFENVCYLEGGMLAWESNS